MVSKVGLEPPVIAGDHASGPTRMSTGLGRLVDGALWALALLPGLALVLLASMAIRVRLADGAWPLPDQPDPKDLGWHNLVTGLAMIGSVLAVVLVPLGTLGAFVLGHRRVSTVPLAVSLALFAVLALVVFGDPGSIGQWIAD